MEIHHLSCLSCPSLILLCLEVPATYVSAADGTYILVISLTTVVIDHQILHCFVSVLSLREQEKQWSIGAIVSDTKLFFRRNVYISGNNFPKSSCCLLPKCINIH